MTDGSQPTEMAALVGPVWSAAKVCEVLGVRSNALAVRLDAGEVLGLVTADGVTVFPVDQFWRRDGRVEVKPGLRPLFRALREYDAWAVAVLLHTPAPELDDATPLGWLGQGNDPSAVENLARVVAREWAAGAGVPLT